MEYFGLRVDMRLTRCPMFEDEFQKKDEGLHLRFGNSLFAKQVAVLSCGSFMGAILVKRLSP